MIVFGTILGTLSFKVLFGFFPSRPRATLRFIVLWPAFRALARDLIILCDCITNLLHSNMLRKFS